ncbi:MAG: radical SAM protein [Rhizobiales bacterium]|nr:radical SAM protein [Hyphomicrobiales bacterium]
MNISIPPAKFSDPDVTAKGETRAHVALVQLETLWINTGTLCNIECAHCYIHSSPTDDRLSYFTLADTLIFLDEIEREELGTKEIGFTGGEPFMNPDMLAMAEAALARGHQVLILTNAMQPLMRPKIRDGLLALKSRHGTALRLRISIDHYSETLHDAERGAGAFEKTLTGLKWLAGEGFSLTIAGRTAPGESETDERAGYAALFAREGIDLDPHDPSMLIVFPEMDETTDVPEITTACWDILNVNPDNMMCATSRMVIKRKGAAGPAVVACTLLPDDPQFELGQTLKEASGPIKLNHRHCAKFCVLGGASCSG